MPTTPQANSEQQDTHGQQQRTEVQTLVHSYVTFCRNAAISGQDHQSPLKMIIASIKSIDHRTVYQTVFPEDPYLDWEYTAKMQTTAFGDSNAALLMLRYLTFPEADTAYARATTSERALSKQIRYVNSFVSAMQQNKLFLNLAEALRTMLLYNLSHLNGTALLERFCTARFKRGTQDDVLRLIAALAQTFFQQTDYNDAMSWALSLCIVDLSFFKEVDRVLAEKESLTNLLRLKHISINTGRPRLLERLANKRGHRETVATNIITSSRPTTSSLTGESMDTFDGWCTRVRFPNTVSAMLKQRLYVVMSQPHIDHAYVVSKIVAPALCGSIVSQPITQPDETQIANVIEQLDIRMAPFAELSLFMRSCFRAFPQRNLRDMTLLKYMQLYLAAYQHKDIWKECWRRIYPLLSYQVIKDVEDFTTKNVFNQEAFIVIANTY